MNSNTEPGLCGDPVWQLLYDRVGRYFENESATKRGSGRCKLCGSEVVDGIMEADGTPACRSRRAITQNRARPAVGAPVAFGSPLKEGSVKNAFFVKGPVCLVAPDRTYVACNVIPSMPLPPEMTAEPVVPGIQNRVLASLVRDPPATPFLLVLWDQRAAVKLVMSESLSRVVICGGVTPRVFDLRAVRRAVDLIERLGTSDFREACQIRIALAGAVDDDDVSAMNDKFQKFLARGMTLRDFATLPRPGDVVWDVAMKAIGEQQNAADQAVGESDAEDAAA